MSGQDFDHIFSIWPGVLSGVRLVCPYVCPVYLHHIRRLPLHYVQNVARSGYGEKVHFGRSRGVLWGS